MKTETQKEFAKRHGFEAGLPKSTEIDRALLELYDTEGLDYRVSDTRQIRAAKVTLRDHVIAVFGVAI